MKKKIELPLTEPMYSTYHHHGPSTAICSDNPSGRNWCLNQAMNLSCNRRFLKGYTSPEIEVGSSGCLDMPYFERIYIPSQFTGGYINPLIRNMLDKGYYVYFGDIDDYYIKGKSWYHKRHFFHNGLICGYDQTDKTYSLYAYDSEWRYRKFRTPQSAFNAGRLSAEKNGCHGIFCALKMKNDNITLSPETIYENLKHYLNSNLEKYSFEGEGRVYGIVVHTYISEYVMRLYRGEIPYERMDRRVFRLIWEHKKVMLERIAKVEEALHFDNTFSEKYRPLVKEADTMRMLYAAYNMKRRDSLLPIISEKLLRIEKNEREILTELTEKMGKELEKDVMGISEK